MEAQRAAVSFDESARSVLDAMIDRAREALAESAYEKGRILRGMVHLRPDDRYESLVIVDVPSSSRSGAVEASYVPSATAWRWVSEHRCAMTIDVMNGTAELGSSADVTSIGDVGIPSRSFDAEATRARLLDREATHLLVLPLRSRAGQVDGMISLEASCRAAIGRRLPWSDQLAEMQLLADMAAPFLAKLPSRRSSDVGPDELLPIIGESMSGPISALLTFARADATVLLAGATGAGKTRLAKWCHQQSARREKPFVSVQLSSIPEELQMGELFGWRKGAFTGALNDNSGHIMRAEGGTLFIDEIDKLSLSAQAGVLRVFDEQIYRNLGDGAKDRQANVRFIVATNVDLPKLVREGKFREDLYYRINVLPVKVPSLAERRDEVADWASYMVSKQHEPGASISSEAAQVLRSCDWPGNLRQLENIVRRTYALAFAESGGKHEPFVIHARHVNQALAFEAGRVRDTLLEAFHRVASAFVAEAKKRGPDDPLDLDLAGALRGFVLATAAMEVGSRKAAFRLLGKETTIANRNHQAQWKRDMQVVEKLCEALGEPAPFGDIAEDEDK